jgi:hypothetical protein
MAGFAGCVELAASGHEAIDTLGIDRGQRCFGRQAETRLAGRKTVPPKPEATAR